MLPTPYNKDAQPFEHFDRPEDLALHRVERDIESGWSGHDQVCAYSGWYGHATEVSHDRLTVKECAGIEVNKVFSYRKVLEYVLQARRQNTLFAV